MFDGEQATVGAIDVRYLSLVLAVLISVGLDVLCGMLEVEDPSSSSVWHGGSLRRSREERRLEWRQ